MAWIERGGGRRYYCRHRRDGKDVRRVSRQSLVLRRALQPGDAIREEDLAVQRPGTGVSAALVRETVGRKVVKAVNAGAILQWDMISEISDAA